jgi:uncharacterized protein YuzE
MRVRYDPDANAAYIRLAEDPIVESEEVAPGIIFDFDEQGRIVGMEFLDAKKDLPIQVLAEAA